MRFHVQQKIAAEFLFTAKFIRKKFQKNLSKENNLCQFSVSEILNFTKIAAYKFVGFFFTLQLEFPTLKLKINSKVGFNFNLGIFNLKVYFQL